MKKDIVYLLLLFALTFSSTHAQEKVVVLGGSYFNSKTLSIYQEKIEKMGGKVIETFLDNKNPMIFVKYDEGRLNPEELAQALSQNEFNQPVYIKNVQNVQQLQELGIHSSNVFKYFEAQSFQSSITDKKEKDFPKEYEKDGKKYVKCDWAPFYYEVTGNPSIDEKNYQKAKQQWIDENPKEYQYIKNQQSK